MTTTTPSVYSVNSTVIHGPTKAEFTIVKRVKSQGVKTLIAADGNRYPMAECSPKIYDFNPGDPVAVRGMPASRKYTYVRKIELHGQEDYFVLQGDTRESQWPATCCFVVQNVPHK